MRSQSLPERTKKAVLVAAVGLLMAVGVGGAASALETLEPSSASTGECPALTAVKYPFVTCEENQYGGLTLSIPDQPAPKECNMKLPDGGCAAGPYEWSLVPQIPPSAR